MIRVVIPPTAEPVTVQEAKSNARIVIDDDDADIARMITAARVSLENRLNRFLMPQTVEFAAPAFGAGIVVPAAPFRSLVSLGYTDTSGAPQTVDPAALFVDSFIEPAAVTLAYGSAWPAAQSGAPVIVRAEVGYASAAEVPAPLKQWILLAVTAFYDNRSSIVVGVSVNELPEDFMHWLWHPYRVYL